MVNHKRKGDQVFAERTNHVVVVDGSGSKVASDVESIKTRLQTLAKSYQTQDPVLAALQSMEVDEEEEQNAMMEESQRIQSKLDEEIQKAQDACQQESSVVTSVAEQVHTLELQREELLHGIDQMEQQQVDLQKMIALHQQEASEEIETIDKVEDERKQQVPRLKTEISLYASTSNIKWDFKDDNMLSGSVSIPSKQSLKLFSIDPRDQSEVETANLLWALME